MQTTNLISQGFNTGVALLNLEKMRESEEYLNSLEIETMIGLEKKYNIRGTVGDQVLTFLSIVKKRMR